MAHSTMFHHFKGGIHIDGQGAITQDQFQCIINYLKGKYNLLGAKEFTHKAKHEMLQSNDVVLSFDDGLKCQYDLALEVLDANKIDAFFFIYTGVFEGIGIELEIFRDFRSRMFSDFDNFFVEFLKTFNLVSKSIISEEILKDAKSFLIDHKLYSENDRIYRYLRDVILNKNGYDLIMNKLMFQFGYSPDEFKSSLFINKSELVDLVKLGHTVGLHSHSHPTMMQRLEAEKQKIEFGINNTILKQICEIEIETMSHPCGRYNEDTLKILHDLGIKIGFRSNLSKMSSRSLLELPRNDHMNVLRDYLN